MKRSLYIKLFFIPIILILSSCNREPIDTIINLKGVNNIKFIAIQNGTDKMMKREITEENDINYFLHSFYSKNEFQKININEKNFCKDAEVDISFTDKSTTLVIDIDTDLGYKITLGSKVYFEGFTWATGTYIAESLMWDEK